MSLANQTCWVVGGVGVIGRGITRGLLKAGATVIVNSRSEERLARFSEDLGHPDRLITINGSLLPGYAGKTVRQTLDAMPLDHVVAHGAVRYWGSFGTNDRRDESHMIQGGRNGTFLQSMTPEDFVGSASQLASLHFSAAQQLIPRIQFSNGPSSYTFVTGDAGGHPQGKRSALGEINTHHVWGLAAALRNERLERDVNCREIRVRLPVNRPAEERNNQPRATPLSEDIGTLCAGLAATADAMDERGELIEVADQESLESLLDRYGAFASSPGDDAA
eukprot:CAMPEP_0197180630 /NCGR_PEP_ID=MMETSP1423-20130617/5176_1 /TAXON_ID=476441 /ORGANISM="Pseudo-nitzschia heimii, Strain UNC1101" /LENGTH=276 /DNA_ID=CAMNT_0042630737 /DNA_START=130 /DNA_END=963 /DNA_ORIENTATION=-